jgi:hypothetical protein
MIKHHLLDGPGNAHIRHDEMPQVHPLGGHSSDNAGHFDRIAGDILCAVSAAARRPRE